MDYWYLYLLIIPYVIAGLFAVFVFAREGYLKSHRNDDLGVAVVLVVLWPLFAVLGGIIVGLRNPIKLGESW